MNTVREAGADTTVQTEILNEVTKLLGETREALAAVL